MNNKHKKEYIIRLAKAHFDFKKALAVQSDKRSMLEGQDIGYFYGLKNGYYDCFGYELGSEIEKE